MCRRLADTREYGQKIFSCKERAVLNILSLWGHGMHEGEISFGFTWMKRYKTYVDPNSGRSYRYNLTTQSTRWLDVTAAPRSELDL